MRVDLEELVEMEKRRIEISSVPIEQIVFYLNDKPFQIEKEIIEEFNFTGLSPINIIDFIDIDSLMDCAIVNKPNPKDYGWVDKEGFDTDGGWMYEGGEEAYESALKTWELKYKWDLINQREQ